MKEYLATILVCLSIMSCSDTKESNEHLKSVSSNEFTSYQLYGDLPSKRLSELIDRIEFTRLEETGESLLSYVPDVYLVNGKIIFFSQDSGDVYVFSDKGEFIDKLNRKGDGPEEYSGVKDFWLEDETIVVHTVKGEIKRYSLTGDFLDSEATNRRISHLYPFHGGYLADMNYNEVNDSLKYLLISLDEQMEMKKMFLPYQSRPVLEMFSSASTLSPIEGALSYLRMMSDTAFIYDAKGVRPFIHYDFGQNWFWKEKRTRAEAFEALGSSDQVWNLINKIGERYIYLMGNVNFEYTETFVIDRVLNQVVKINKEKNPEESFGLSISHWDGDFVYGTISSPDISDLISELTKEQWSFSQGTTLEEIESSENPVLIKLKLKGGDDW